MRAAHTRKREDSARTTREGQHAKNITSGTVGAMFAEIPKKWKTAKCAITVGKQLITLGRNAKSL